MRSRPFVAVLLAMLAALPSGVRCEEPVERNDPSGYPDLRQALSSQDSAEPCVGRWNADLILGLPTGLRLQRDIFGENAIALRAEGFLGLEAIFPAAGLGLRCRWNTHPGQSDTIQINPGLDAYLLANPLSHSSGFLGGGPRTVGLFTADVDLLWQHDFRNGWAAQSGLKLGVGVSDATGYAIPVVGILTGFRF